MPDKRTRPHEKENLHIIQFLRFEFLIVGIRQVRCLVAAFHAERKCEHLCKRHSSRRVGKYGETYIGDAFYHGVIGLIGRSQSISRELAHLYPAIRSLFQFLAPLVDQHALRVQRRQEIAVLQADDRFSRERRRGKHAGNQCCRPSRRQGRVTVTLDHDGTSLRLFPLCYGLLVLLISSQRTQFAFFPRTAAGYFSWLPASVPQIRFDHFARGVSGNAGDKFHELRDLVVREVFGAELFDLLLRGCFALFQGNDRFYRFAEDAIGDTDNRALQVLPAVRRPVGDLQLELS